MSNVAARYVVLGSGSKLYSEVEQFLGGRLGRAYRTSDFFSDRFVAGSDEITIVFSLLEPPDLERVFRQTAGTVLVVGSCAALSPVWRRFGYSRRKRHQLNAVLAEGDVRIKYIFFGDFFLKERRGLSFSSDFSEFWDICDYAVRAPGQVVLGYRLVGSKDVMSCILTRADMMLAPVSTALIKKLTRYSYGYNNAAAAETEGLDAIPYYSW